jgi:dipeptidyl aminopeptidase/acylaminoacyl peptidase
LVRVDLKDGTTRTVAEGEITDFEPAPDHNVVAILEAGADLQARLGRPLHGDWGLADQTQHLALVEVSTGRRADVCPGCDVLASLLSWSANSRSVLVFARGADAPWRAGAFWRFDTTGRGTRLTSAPFAPSMQLRPEVVQAGWLGGDPVALGRARPADPAAWYRLAAGGPVRLGVRLPDAGTVIAADAHDLSIIAGERLWRVDGHGGARRIGPDLPIRPLRTFTARDGRIGRAWSPTGWALARAGGVSTVLSVDVAGVAQVASIPDDASILATGPTGLLTQAPGAGGRLEVGLAGPDRPVRSLSTLNASLATVDALDVRAIDHAGPDGRPLRSWLFLPRREPGLPPPPLVVKVYSGDVYRDWPRPKPPVLGFVGDVRVLTGAGYAVLTPSLPAPDRRPAEPAAGLADRILAVVDAAARSPATAGTFDPERLALFGQSYGGYTVTAALTQTDRFRAAIDQSGYVDLVSEWAGLSATQRSAPEPGGRSNGATGGMESAQGRMGVPPWADPARYDRNSPLMAADKITTPLLILHGDQDGNVSLAQSEALFSALYRQGKDALLVTYWGEGHNIASPGNVRDLYTEVLRFLADHLNADGAAPRANPATASASAAPRPRPPRP